MHFSVRQPLITDADIHGKVTKVSSGPRSARDPRSRASSWHLPQNRAGGGRGAACASLHRASPCAARILEGNAALGNALLAVVRGLQEFCSASLQLRSSNSAITWREAQWNVSPSHARRPTRTFESVLRSPAIAPSFCRSSARAAPPSAPLPRALPAWRPRARRRQRVWAGSSRRSRPAPGARRSPLQKKRRALREPQDYGGAARRVRGFAFGLRAGRLGPRESVRRPRGASFARPGGGDPAAVVRLSAAAPLSAPGFFRYLYGRGKEKRRCGRWVRARDLSLPAGCGRPSQHGTSPPARLAAFSLVLFRRCPRGAPCGCSWAPPEVRSGSALGLRCPALLLQVTVWNSARARAASSIWRRCASRQPRFAFASRRAAPFRWILPRTFPAGAVGAARVCSAPVPAAAAAARGSAPPPRAAPRRAAPLLLGRLVAFGVLSDLVTALINPNSRADSPFRMGNVAAPASDASCLIKIAVLMVLLLMCACRTDLRVLVWYERKHHGAGSSKLFKLLTDAFCARNLNSLELHAGFGQRCTRCCFKPVGSCEQNIETRSGNAGLAVSVSALCGVIPGKLARDFPRQTVAFVKGFKGKWCSKRVWFLAERCWSDVRTAAWRCVALRAPCSSPAHQSPAGSVGFLLLCVLCPSAALC